MIWLLIAELHYKTRRGSMLKIDVACSSGRGESSLWGGGRGVMYTYDIIKYKKKLKMTFKKQKPL